MMHAVHRNGIVVGVALALMLATPDAAKHPAVAARELPPLGSSSGHGKRATQGPERHLSVAERALLRGYHAALQAAGPRHASRENLLHQIRHNPPVAFVEGYWATPIDLGAVFQVAAVRDALDENISTGPEGREASELLADPNRLKQLTAFAFTAHPLRLHAGLAFVGEFPRVTASAPRTSGIYIVPVKDVEWAIVEYLPPTVAAPDAERECYFFCGNPETWDFDGDGIPNARDDDDDNDRVPDNEDDYPYWPGESACGCDPQRFIGFTTKFPTEITRAVLDAHRSVAHIGADANAVNLGQVPGSESHILFLFPPSMRPLVEHRRDCPDSADPTIRYVDTDPDACARIRFRCREGEEAFSGGCGCGCRKP